MFSTVTYFKNVRCQFTTNASLLQQSITSIAPLLFMSIFYDICNIGILSVTLTQYSWRARFPFWNRTEGRDHSMLNILFFFEPLTSLLQSFSSQVDPVLVPSAIGEIAFHIVFFSLQRQIKPESLEMKQIILTAGRLD